jgi:serine/threonine-protein kinase mTOR
MQDISHKMRLAIEAEAQNLPSQMFSNFISRLVSSGINLLNYDLKDSRYRIVGLVVLDCLLDINDEIMAERRVEIANQLRKVLENEKQNIEVTGDVIRKASESIGHLARVASTTEIEFLDFYVTKSIEWLSPRRSDANKFSAVLILTQLATNSPALIFMKRKNFFTVIWEMIFDRNFLIREAAAGSLNAVMLLVSQRESTDEYIRLALHQIEIGCNSTYGEKIHGFLLIFDCLLSVSVIPSMELLNTIRNVNMRLQDLFWEVLQRKDSRDANIKQKVLVLIPKLAALSQATFIQHNQYTAPLNFLSYSVRHLLDVIYAHKDRSVAYLALGSFLVSMAPAIKGVNAIIDDVFSAIKIGFKDPFCIEALDCLSVVVKASGGGHGFVDSELVNAMFQGGLTPELIKSLKVIVKTTPSIRGHVQSKLRAHITNILLNHTVVRDDPNQTGITRRTASNAPPRRPLAAVPPTLLSGLFSSSKPLTATSKRAPWGGVGISQEPSTDNELVLALQVLASFDFLPNQFNDSRSRNKSFQSQFSLSNSWTEKHTSSSSSLPSPSMAGNESEMLLRVVREGVVRYLDDANPAIRDAAAITCATVLNKVVDTVEDSAGDGGKYLIQVMDRLLMLGVGDECEEIRVHVFLSLPPSLDHIVSNSENVHCLIEAMNDESFDVRSAAMSVLARVAHYDTVHVMPLVRLMLSKLMRQLLNSKDHLLRQESVQLLQAMVRGTNVLIVPYVWQIMEPLLASLDDPSPAIVSAAVSTIGELARVSPEDIEVHLDVLFPRLIQALNDHSSVNKQEICVIALGKVVSSLNIVSKPYTTYPSLFESLVRAIQRSDVAAASLRLQAMRTVGLLGAIDPDSYHKSLRTTGVLTVLPSQGDFDEDEGDKKRDEGDRPAQEAEEDDQLISLDKYYLSVVVNSLMTILRDASLSSHHQTAVGVTLRIVRILGFQSDPLLENVINAFTYRFYHSDTGGALQETILDHLITMVYVVGRDISRHLTTIVKLTSDCFNTHLALCLSMVEALCFILLPQDFNGVLREVLPCMVQVNRDELLQDRDELLTTRSESNSLDHSAPPTLNGLVGSKKGASLPKSSKIFTTIANISPALGEYRRQLIPVILKVVEETSVRPETRREALCAVMQLAIDSSDLNEFASRIIHPLLRLLSGSEVLLQIAALTSLSCMVCRLRTSYLPFVIPAKRKISLMVQRDSLTTRVPIPQLDEYESLVNLLLKQKPLPLNPSDRSTITIKSEDNISSRLEKCRTIHSSLRVEFRALEMAWTLSGRTTTSDLVEWMRRLSIEFIRQSPSPILRPCAVLAKVYQPLAHELFNAAFVSVWDEIFLQDNADPYADIPLISGLEMALRSPQIPGNIRQVLLNLAEFMDMQDKRLPLDIQLLAKQAEAANMFAKCLHYREIEFNSVNTLPSSECIEALITVNSQLGMKEAASGVLTYVRDRHKHIQIEPYWLEKLTRWQEARDSYTKQSQQWRTSHPEDTPAQHENWMNSELGYLRCLHALGEDTDLCTTAREVLSHVRAVEGQVDSYDTWMTEVQRLGANAAWMLGKWDQMEQFLDGGTLGKHHDVQLENDGTFYEAVFSIHRCDYKRASKLVGETREAVSTNISSLLSESYSRAYRSMVTMQVLSELEELIDYRKYESKCLSGTGFTPGAVDISKCLSRRTSNGIEIIEDSVHEILEDLALKKLTLVQKWQSRLQCAPREVDVYRLILVPSLSPPSFLIRF